MPECNMISTPPTTLMSPAIDVSKQEFNRLMGYPANHTPDDRINALALQTRRWYQKTGRPWTYTREIEITNIEGNKIYLETGTVLNSSALAKKLNTGKAKPIN